MPFAMDWAEVMYRFHLHNPHIENAIQCLKISSVWTVWVYGMHASGQVLLAT